MILSGEKTEEYREIKSHWINHFVDFYCGRKPNDGNNLQWLLCDIKDDPDRVFSKMLLKGIDTITFSNGYAKDRPQFEIELKGIEIKEGNPKWGAEPGKKYFVLSLGEILLPF